MTQSKIPSLNTGLKAPVTMVLTLSPQEQNLERFKTNKQTMSRPHLKPITSIPGGVIFFFYIIMENSEQIQK